jgi:hypothetical protein
MATESSSLLNPPSAERPGSIAGGLAPPTPVRAKTTEEAAVDVIGREVITHTDSPSGEPLSSSRIASSSSPEASPIVGSVDVLASGVLSPSGGSDTTLEDSSLPAVVVEAVPEAAPTTAATTPAVVVEAVPEAAPTTAATTPAVVVEAVPGTAATPAAVGTGAAAPTGPTFTVRPGTTTLADIQANATTINANGMPGNVLNQVKGHMETMYGAGNTTIGSKMARDASGKYDLDTWDNRGTPCYKMDVTFVVTNYDVSATPPTVRGRVEVTKTIYTNAVDPKQALQIIDAIKKGVIDSANGTDATLQRESTFLLDFDKDKKTGQFTGLKSIKGRTTNINLPLPTTEAASYTFKGKRIKGTERNVRRVTYQSKSEMLQKGASYAIRGTGGRDVVMNRIGAKHLTVDTFVKDIEKKEKELEETKKKSFMRFNGLFGNRESSDVGTFKAYSEAFDAVGAAGGKISTTPTTPTIPKTEVALRPEWESIPKIKAYVQAHNAVVAAEQLKTTELATAQSNVDRLQTEADALNGQLTAARAAVAAQQPTYEAAMREKEDADQELRDATEARGRLPPSEIGGSPEHTAAYNRYITAQDRKQAARTNLDGIKAERTRLKSVVTSYDREARAKQEEHRQAGDALRQLPNQLDRQVASAQRKFDKIQTKFDTLSEKMSKQLAEFRREYDELAELKRTVDAMVAVLVTDLVISPTVTLTAEDLQKLQQTQARLAAIEADNRELLENLGLTGTAPIVASFIPPTSP